jgi:hypothetical protein
MSLVVTSAIDVTSVSVAAAELDVSEVLDAADELAPELSDPLDAARLVLEKALGAGELGLPTYGSSVPCSQPSRHPIEAAEVSDTRSAIRTD